MPSATTPYRSQPDREAVLLARALQLVLAWPCPVCGQAFPCACDLGETIPQPSEGNDERPE